MRFNFKKALAGTATVAVIATVAPFISAGVASAAVNNGSFPLTPPSGDSDTAFTVGIGGAAQCPGDSANSGYRVNSFMVPAAQDINTLTFNGSGVPQSTLGFSQNLFDLFGTPYQSVLTFLQTSPGGPGGIPALPQFNYAVYGPGVVPPGAYKIGIACTLGANTESFWSKVITITDNPSGTDTSQLLYSEGAQALSPILDSVTPGDGQLTANFTPGGSDPADTSYLVIADSVDPLVADGVEFGIGSPITVSGLVNGEDYTVTVIAENGVPSPGVGSVPSNAIVATPSVVRTAPVVTASPGGVGEASVTWTPAGGAPTSYLVSISPAPTVGSATQTILASDPLAATFTDLGAGPHTVTVQAQGYPAGESAPAGTDDVTVLGGDGTPATLIQTIQVDRAQVNAIVFEQDCGLGWVTTPCAVDMTEGTLDATGQYYPATGVLKPIRVIDARDTDKGWIVTANVDDDFTDVGKAFDAQALGWTPRELFQSPALGNGYTMTVDPGPSIAPWTSDALKDGTAVLMESVADGGGIQRGLGLAVYEADLSILVPISAPSGAYSADIVFTLVNKT